MTLTGEVVKMISHTSVVTILVLWYENLDLETFVSNPWHVSYPQPDTEIKSWAILVRATLDD